MDKKLPNWYELHKKKKCPYCGEDTKREIIDNFARIDGNATKLEKVSCFKYYPKHSYYWFWPLYETRFKNT